MEKLSPGNKVFGRKFFIAIVFLFITAILERIPITELKFS